MDDANDKSVEVRCTVYQYEDPELYAYLTALPAGRNRKRTLTIRLLLAGLNSQAVPALPHSVATVNSTQPLVQVEPVPPEQLVATQALTIPVASVKKKNRRRGDRHE